MRPRAGVASAEPGTPLLASTLHDVVAVVLPQDPALDPGTRRAVENEISRYLADQLRALPAYLRAPFQATLAVFALAPIVRWARPFGRLPSAARAHYVARWDHAPFAPLRDFIKLIRSTALLVYFDHPSVREQLQHARAARHQ